MQKERLVEYLETHGWELYKAYENGGFSGKNVDRPAF
ncbi:MAG: recombinase family protein [Caldisericaceae bacterium]